MNVNEWGEMALGAEGKGEEKEMIVGGCKH